MNLTRIRWTMLTWNPFSGCEEVSPECAYCYAKSLAEQKRGTPGFPNGFDLTLRPHKIAEPSRVREPSLIFCNSMSDPGLKGIPDAYLDLVWDQMETVPRHRYQVLTKRPAEVLAYLKRRGRRVPPSVWMGVTIGIQGTAWRLNILKQFRELGARVLFVSAEPLLGDALKLDLNGVDWLIGGGESGNHALTPRRLRVEADSLLTACQPEEMPAAKREWAKLRKRAASIEERFLVRRAAGTGAWEPTERAIRLARQLRDDCAAAGTAFFWKQWGGSKPEVGGHLLDGVEHSGMPLLVPGAVPEGYVHAAAKAAAESAREARVEKRRQLPLILPGTDDSTLTGDA